MAASNINLLPLELSAKSGVAKLAALLKRVSTFMIMIFLVLGFMALAFIIFYSIRLDDTLKANQALASQISTLEVTEQKTVLVKDRLQKIKGIKAQPDVIAAVDGIRSLSAVLPSGVSVADTSIDAGKTNFSFNVTDSSVLVNFLANLVTNSNYKQLTIKNFTFTPATGYLVSFESNAK